MAKPTVKELEVALDREKQERVEAETRATRANERARDADEAYRKLQLDLVAAREDAKRLEEKLSATQSAKPASAPPAKAAGPVVISSKSNEAVEQMLQRIEGLRELLATASIELSQLNADEVALAKKRSRVLTDACALLARAVGATGQAPPPIPSAALEARLSMAPVVDISEVADLIESLRPPRAPKV